MVTTSPGVCTVIAYLNQADVYDQRMCICHRKVLNAILTAVGHAAHHCNTMFAVGSSENLKAADLGTNSVG
jgi:hypothetical protein